MLDSLMNPQIAYDALGRRIQLVDTADTVTTRYYYDGDRVLLDQEDAGSGFADARCFVYGNYIDEMLVMVDDLETTPVDHYAGHDHLYSVVVLFSDAGTVLERYEYDAYGRPTVYNSDFTQTYDVSQQGNPYLFTGRRLDALDDAALTVYYYRARHFDPQTGRFMQRDPLGVVPNAQKPNRFSPVTQYRDGINLYEYVKSNPVNYVDGYGLACGWQIAKCRRAIIHFDIDISVLTSTISSEPTHYASSIEDLETTTVSVSFYHHDVRLRAYEKPYCHGPIEEEYTKGFFARSPRNAVLAYLFETLTGLGTGTVEGIVEDRGVGEECVTKCVSRFEYMKVKDRFSGYEPRLYHLTRHNCQHWAHYVLTGELMPAGTRGSLLF